MRTKIAFQFRWPSNKCQSKDHLILEYNHTISFLSTVHTRCDDVTLCTYLVRYVTNQQTINSDQRQIRRGLGGCECTLNGNHDKGYFPGLGQETNCLILTAFCKASSYSAAHIQFNHELVQISISSVGTKWLNNWYAIGVIIATHAIKRNWFETKKKDIYY